MRSIGLERDRNCALDLFWIEPIGIMTSYHFIHCICFRNKGLSLALPVYFLVDYHVPSEPLLITILWLGCILGTLRVPNRLLRVNTL